MVQRCGNSEEHMPCFRCSVILVLVHSAGLFQLVSGDIRVGVSIAARSGKSKLLQQVISDPELSVTSKLFVGATGSSLVVTISAPLVFWGVKSAVLGPAMEPNPRFKPIATSVQ